MEANSGDPHSVASDLGLHCLPLSQRKDAMLIWVSYFMPSARATVTNLA